MSSILLRIPALEVRYFSMGTLLEERAISELDPTLGPTSGIALKVDYSQKHSGSIIRAILTLILIWALETTITVQLQSVSELEESGRLLAKN